MESQQVKQLQTPIGDVFITDGSHRVPFAVGKNSFDLPYEWSGGILHTETNYDIILKTEDLEIGVDYKIVFSAGNLRYEASDEGTEALSVTAAGWTVGIGMWDPNDGEKTRQILSGSVGYDETMFRQYRIHRSDDACGYTFRLLDRTGDEITFKVAWIKHEGADPRCYESAVGFWLT